MSTDDMAGSAYVSSPDEVSPYYPDRYIRPMPRRSIRSRLSQEAAESIAYPPNPPSATLPAYSHYGQDGRPRSSTEMLTQPSKDYEHDPESYQDDDEHDHDCPHHPHHHHHHHCHHHEDEDEDLESVEDNSPVAQRHANAYRSSPRSPRSHRHARYNSFGGKSSGPDGYEAFENTNNKKKRKIPTSGSLSLHQSSLNSDFATLGLSRDTAAEEAAAAQQYSPSSGLGVQGAGRGRTGRRSSVRNPLGPSTNGGNVRSKYDAPSTPTQGEAKPDQGIISKAIANATTLLRNPLGKGQENVGVLDQQTNTTPTNSQFTFTCESDSKGVKFPEQSLYSPDYAQRVNSNSSIPPTTPNPKSYVQGTPTQAYGGNPGQHPTAQPQHGAHGQKQKPRRRRGDVYALAARQRRLQQEYSNLQHPPNPEDIWICEFCEYESIFGTQPHALVRQYEIKDRRERKRLAEKRRLLEKAKLKGRKGKKQTKNAGKNASTASQQNVNNPNYDNQPLDQMDDYLDDGYDDDPIPMPEPPIQAPVKQSMPGSYNAGAGRTSAGIAGGGTAGTGTVR